MLNIAGYAVVQEYKYINIEIYMIFIVYTVKISISKVNLVVY